MFRIVILVVALVAGGSAAMIALNVRPTTTIVESAPPPKAQDVLVAATDVAQGQALTKESMRWQSWPEGLVNPAFIMRAARPDAVEHLAGSLLRSRVIAGEPIVNEKLVPQNSGFLSAMLPAGKRAVAVRVSAENTAGGFILPNDRVDVIHTIEEQAEGQRAQRSHTILRNVPVLAVDQTVDESHKEPKGKDPKPEKAKTQSTALGKTATLELDPAQAELITAAEAKGRLSLVLRSAADNGEVPTMTRNSPQTIRIIRAGHSEILRVH
jgi:pilus assembly protein CpaB